MFMPSRKSKMLQTGGSLASDAVMASVAKGSLVAHTNEVQAGGAKRPRSTAKKSTSKSKPVYRQCGGSIASDAVQALVPESAMHLHTNLFCPPEHPAGHVGAGHVGAGHVGAGQVGAGRTKKPTSRKPKSKARKMGHPKRKQRGGNIEYGLSLPAPATGDMAKSLAVPASGFMDISSSVLSKMAAYPDCLNQSKFTFGGVQDGAGKKRRSKSNGQKDCQCGAGVKKSLPKPKKKPARSKSAAKKPSSR